MNDFDFEELDKAVTNLATKTQDEHGNPIAPQTPAPRMSILPSTPADTKPAPVSEPTPSAPIVVTPTESPAVTSASTPPKHRLDNTRSRRGSFMDIVPPSPRKVPTRVGVSVQPVSKMEEIIPEQPQGSDPELVKAPEPKVEIAVEPPVESISVTRSQPKPTEPESEPRSEAADVSEEVSWPDPLDFNDAPGKSAKPAEPESTEPVSPFLAEAKVEKRPLGAFSNFRPAEVPKPEAPKPAEEKLEKPQDELTPGADGTFEEPKKDKAPLPPKEGEKLDDKEPAKPDLHGAAMMAIPDQYRPEPKTTDKTTRPVFDTKEYHPPLIEATGHHEHRGGGSVWGKIFVALVALALIAVGGYFAYVYFVQQ
jgi:hypothetical protein